MGRPDQSHPAGRVQKFPHGETKESTDGGEAGGGDRRCHHRTSHTRKKANASSTPMSPTMELFVVKDCQSLTSPPAKVQ